VRQRALRRAGEIVLAVSLGVIVIALLDRAGGKDPWLPAWFGALGVACMFVGLPLGLGLRGLGVRGDPLDPPPSR
jgi:hypothetical protein